MPKMLRFAAAVALLLAAWSIPAPVVEALPSGCACFFCSGYPNSACQDPDTDEWTTCWAYSNEKCA